MLRDLLLTFATLGSAIFLVTATEVTVSVSATASHPVPTALWGATLDEINHSIDGGLYAEMIKNRAFQKVTPGTPESLDGWHSVGGANIEVIQETVPVSTALPNALQVTFPSGKILPVGIGNEGYFGGLQLDTTTTYGISFWFRFPTPSNFSGSANIGFQTTGGLSLGSVNVGISGTQTAWTQVTTTLRITRQPTNNNNWFAITLPGTASSGQVINFALISVMPPTFNARPNYVRPEIASSLAAMAPAFLRYPGADALLGNGGDGERWRWNNTVNGIVKRPGHMSSGGYLSTDGFGLYEFLQLCEDIGSIPIMTVYAGLTQDGTVVSESDLLPIIQEATDQINFAIANQFQAQGSIRSTMGHPGPFNVPYIEIGANEENTSEEYQDRWTDFVTILSQSFPQLNFIASSSVNSPPLIPDPTQWDVHFHQTEGWFAQNSFYFDSFERNDTQYLVGEFQADEGEITYPTMQSATDEAAFMTGIERNGDIIIGAGHSPLMNNIPLTTTSPSIISFDQSRTSVVLSISYLVQKAFATNMFPFYIPSTLPDPNGSVFWSITSNLQTNGNYIIKLVNTGGVAENVTFVLPRTYTSSNQLVLTGSPTASNTPSTPSAVTLPAVVAGPGGTPSTTLSFIASPCSVNILRV